MRRLAVAAVTLSMFAASAQSSAAAPSAAGRVRGSVLEWDTGRPIAGAVIRLPDHGVKTTSVSDGSFSFVSSLPTQLPYRPVHAIVTAHGWGRWEIHGAPLYPGDVLVLRAELTREPWSHTVAPPGERRAALPAAPSEARRHTDTCTGWKHQLVPPAKIRVRITDRNVSKRYGFGFYVKHVLPNEWLPFWDGDALRAGAIAVKTYAAYRAMPGNAYSGGKHCADLRDDNYDQVFDPSWSTEATNQAVNATLGSILFRGGGLFLSQYWNGHKGDPCAYVKKEYPGRMSQEGTYTCAVKKKMEWPRIVQTFYPRTTWHYLYQLLLNPSVESGAMNPWKPKNKTKIQRTKGVAEKGDHFMRLLPKKPGARISVYQARPFLGTGNTRYNAHAALRCPRHHKSPCSVVLKVTAVRKSGDKILRYRSMKVPSDGRWRFYRFHPRRHGKDHVEVRLRIDARKTIAVDAVGLFRA